MRANTKTTEWIAVSIQTKQDFQVSPAKKKVVFGFGADQSETKSKHAESVDHFIKKFQAVVAS